MMGLDCPRQMFLDKVGCSSSNSFIHMDLCLWLNFVPGRGYVEADFGISGFKDLAEMSPNPPCTTGPPVQRPATWFWHLLPSECFLSLELCYPFSNPGMGQGHPSPSQLCYNNFGPQVERVRISVRNSGSQSQIEILILLIQISPDKCQYPMTMGM